jgi:hypothetical protein
MSGRNSLHGSADLVTNLMSTETTLCISSAMLHNGCHRSQPEVMFEKLLPTPVRAHSLPEVKARQARRCSALYSCDFVNA